LVDVYSVTYNCLKTQVYMAETCGSSVQKYKNIPQNFGGEI